MIVEEFKDPDSATGSHPAKVNLFDAIADVASALSSGRRIEIIDLLAQGERCVEDIAYELKQSLANTSHHLRILAKSNLVATRRDGTRVYYRLAGPEVEDLWHALRETAMTRRDDLTRLANTYLGPLDEVDVVDQHELLKRLAKGSVIVIDVRPREEYLSGHVQGAVSVPLEELPSYLAVLPKEIDIVAYCRGPLCVFAPEAVRYLRSNGYLARRLRDGFPEWRKSGLPIATGTGPDPSKS
jgi:rhodanese-related sulfurtransferase